MSARFWWPSASLAAIHDLTIAGAGLLAVGLVAFIAGLHGLRRRSLQRAPWAIRWYEACATFLGVGVLAGILLATGARWTPGHLLGAHVAPNLAGWFGTAIVGTLHTSSPSLTETRLRSRRCSVRPSPAGRRPPRLWPQASASPPGRS
jgi:hypothetical protein